MRLNQLVLFISKCPEEYTGSKQFEMPESGGSLGRDPGCTLPLSDHNRFISGTHCLVTVYGNTYYLSDVSTNGTLVNGNKILKNQPVSICDGDSITLGQYEIGIVLEQVTATQDIASDIAPERDSTDPLLNLGEAVVEESEQVGSLEELFMETKPDEVDTHDPVAHLRFSMQREDDHLIRDENTKEDIKIEPIDNRRQLVDDSFSIHSEFDLPNLIPEDWMESESQTLDLGRGMHDSPLPSFKNSSRTDTETNSGSINATPVSPTKTPPDVAAQREVTSSEAGQKWEEVTQPFVPTAQESEVQQETQRATPQVEHIESASNPMQVTASSELGRAFYEGLGVTDPELISDEAAFFKQMGTCLRLCIENLQKDLHEVESLKEEQGSAQQEANLTELMLILNSQNLLAPNELVEQMLDELNEHQIIYNKAINELLIEQSKISDPVTFANEYRRSLFTTKSKLWSEYQQFYAQNRRQLLESSLKGQIKDMYNKTIKGSHA